MSDPICYVVRGTDEENDPIEESYPILDLATEAWGAYYSAHAERVEIIAVAEDGTETPLPSYEGALRERDALGATVEKLIAGGEELRGYLAAAIGRFEDKAAELAAIATAVEEAGIVPRPDDALLDRVRRLIADANQIEGERDTLARVLEARDDEAEKAIRAESAIRADERKRAEDEHKALDDDGRQRDANRIERLEGEVAKLRRLVDDADKAKAEHAATRDELRRLHDVLSGKRGAP